MTKIHEILNGRFSIGREQIPSSEESPTIVKFIFENLNLCFSEFLYNLEKRYSLEDMSISRYFKVFLGNLPYDCRESDIHAFFKGFGPIKAVVLKNNYGFCEFLDYYDARDAVKELREQ